MKLEAARTRRERQYTDTRNRERAESGSEQAESGSEQAESGRREIHKSERVSRERELGSRNHSTMNTECSLDNVFVAA